MKQFSQRIKFFLNLISWKLAGTLRMETLSGFLISFLDDLIPHRDAQDFGKTHRGSGLDADTSSKHQPQTNCVGTGFLSSAWSLAPGPLTEYLSLTFIFFL